MNLENQLLEKFQVEELEKRYEFTWIDDVVVGSGPGPGTGTSLSTGLTGVPIGEAGTITPPPPPPPATK